MWLAIGALKPLVSPDNPALLLLLAGLGIAGGVFAVQATVHVLRESLPQIPALMLWCVPGLLIVLPLIAIAGRFRNSADAWVFGIALLLGYVGAAALQARRMLRMRD